LYVFAAWNRGLEPKEMMKMTTAKPRGAMWPMTAIALVGMLVLTACLGGAAKPPEITITAPTADVALNVGQSIAIVGTATGDAISRVDVIIDGTTYATLNAPDKSKGVPSFPINVPWTPLAAGTHAIQLKAYGPPDDKLLTQSEPLVLNAQAASVPATPTAEVAAQPTDAAAAVPTQAPPQPTAAPGAAVPTAAPAAGNPPAAPAAPAAGNTTAPSLSVTNEFVNVRTGPDTAYDKVGELQQGQTAPVKGKSADGKWWQISFPSGPGGNGWVINDYVQANPAAANAPVAAAPPRPTVAVVAAPAQPAAPAPVLVPLVTAAPPQVAPAPAPAPAQGQLVGSAGVLRVEANPVPSGGTAFATWNIPNFKSGEFDRGDGQGFKGPIAQAMRVDVPGVTGARTIRLRWTDNNNAVNEDSLTLNGGAAAAPAPAPVTNAECNENNPDWQAGKNNNPSNWTFCKRKDLNYVGDDPGSIAYVDRNDKVYQMAWDVYGVKGVYLVFEPNSSRGPAAANGKSLPTTGTGPISFKMSDFEQGCYRITLRLDTNRNNDRADFGEKILCIGIGNPNQGGGATATPGSGGGGGGGGEPTAMP
jgi:uncharacterized protein YraI